MWLPQPGRGLWGTPPGTRGSHRAGQRPIRVSTVARALNIVFVRVSHQDLTEQGGNHTVLERLYELEE